MTDHHQVRRDGMKRGDRAIVLPVPGQPRHYVISFEGAATWIEVMTDQQVVVTVGYAPFNITSHDPPDDWDRYLYEGGFSGPPRRLSRPPLALRGKPARCHVSMEGAVTVEVTTTCQLLVAGLAIVTWHAPPQLRVIRGDKP